MKQLSFILLVFALGFYSSVFAQMFKPEDVHSWSINYKIPTHVKVGDEITLNFSCNLMERIRIFSAIQPEGKPPIIPLRFFLDKSSSGVEVVGNVIDDPERITAFDDIFRKDISFYEKAVTISQKVKITNENPVLVGYLYYQMISDDMSIPWNYKFTVPLNPR